MSNTEHDNDIRQDIAEGVSLARELSFLFGEDVVKQAQLIDIADLNMTDDMTAAVTEGVRQLKQMKGDPAAQREWVQKQTSGLCLLLCLWIMDMNILDKIQSGSFLK